MVVTIERSFATKGDFDLFYAIRIQKIDKVKELIAQGADINQINMCGRGHCLAVYYNDYDVVRLLIEADAFINIKDKHGKHCWALQKRRKILTLFLFLSE